MKTAFLLKNNWIEIFDNLSDKQAGVLIKSLFRYNVNGEKPADLTDIEVKAYFNMMLLDCNTMKANYDRRCETSAENGKLGGRPRSEKPNKPNSKPNKPNNLSKPDNDNENENDIKPPTPFEKYFKKFHLDFAKGKWLDLVLRWLTHREAIGKPFERQYETESFFSSLERESDNDLKLAEAIINHSISGNKWASLVVPDSIRKEVEERKKNKNEKPKEVTVFK